MRNSWSYSLKQHPFIYQDIVLVACFTLPPPWQGRPISTSLSLQPFLVSELYIFGLPSEPKARLATPAETSEAYEISIFNGCHRTSVLTSWGRGFSLSEKKFWKETLHCLLSLRCTVTATYFQECYCLPGLCTWIFFFSVSNRQHDKTIMAGTHFLIVWVEAGWLLPPLTLCILHLDLQWHQ